MLSMVRESSNLDQSGRNLNKRELKRVTCILSRQRQLVYSSSSSSKTKHNRTKTLSCETLKRQTKYFIK